MIDKIKVLIGEELEDDLVSIYIDRAVTSVSHYLNNERITRDEILTKYESAILLLVENTYLVKDKKFIKSYSQGKRSVSYSEDVFETIPEDVRRLLPTPYLRMF